MQSYISSRVDAEHLKDVLVVRVALETTAVRAILSPWPVECPRDWLRRINTPLSARELRRLRLSLQRGQPYGEDGWVQRTAKELGLEHTIRPEGRPPKRSEAGGGAKP